MMIPKKKIQEQMEYFFRDTCGEPTRLLLAYAFLKDWVDHYDVPEEGALRVTDELNVEVE